MFGKMKKLVRRTKGDMALQAVLLLGAGFLVVFGLMTLWDTTAKPAVEKQTGAILKGDKTYAK